MDGETAHIPADQGFCLKTVQALRALRDPRDGGTEICVSELPRLHHALMDLSHQITKLSLSLLVTPALPAHGKQFEKIQILPHWSLQVDGRTLGGPPVDSNRSLGGWIGWPGLPWSMSVSGSGCPGESGSVAGAVWRALSTVHYVLCSVHCCVLLCAILWSDVCTTFACYVHFCVVFCTLLCCAEYTTVAYYVHYCGILCALLWCAVCTSMLCYVHYCAPCLALPPQLWHITTGYCTPLSCAPKDSKAVRWSAVRAVRCTLECGAGCTMPPQVWHITSSPTQS